MKTYNKRSNARRAALAQLGAEAVEGTHFRLIEAEPGQFAVEVIGQEAEETFAPPAFLQREAASHATKAAGAPQAPAAKPVAAAEPPRPKPARTAPMRAGKVGPKATAEPAAEPKAVTPKQREGTKQALLIAMLSRAEGATVPEVVEATGWQAHTVRGAMFGALKKRLGLEVTSEKVEDRGRVYRVEG
jgi:cell division septation protein DedD